MDKGGETWLRSLRGRPYDEAKKELMTLNGVGAKVTHITGHYSLRSAHILLMMYHHCSMLPGLMVKNIKFQYNSLFIGKQRSLDSMH